MQFPENPALLCVTSDPSIVNIDSKQFVNFQHTIICVKVSVTADPRCTTTTNPVTGEQSTDGSVTFSVEQGTSTDGSWSVTSMYFPGQSVQVTITQIGRANRDNLTY